MPLGVAVASPDSTALHCIDPVGWGALGFVSASHVGLRWNGAYTLLGAVMLSAWVALMALT